MGCSVSVFHSRIGIRILFDHAGRWLAMSMITEDLTAKFDDEFYRRMNEPHWACGKVDCDCDELTDAALDNDMRDREEANDRI